MEKLIFVIAIVVISMIHSWLQKRKEQPEEESSPWPKPQPRHPNAPPPLNRPPQPAPKAGNWEEELRRLLQGGEPARPRPPVVIAAPPPLPRTPSARPRVVPAPVVTVEPDGDMDTGLPVRMPTLEKSAQAFLRASSLEARVAEHMRGVDARVTSHAAPEIKRTKAPEVREALALVRGRQSQRAAIIASVILGPPKALEG